MASILNKEQQLNVNNLTVQDSTTLHRTTLKNSGSHSDKLEFDGYLVFYSF